MSDIALVDVETVRENRSCLFTARDAFDAPEEVLLVACPDGDKPVKAWVNQCTHESQRLDRGMGPVMRDGGLICPKHGSIFDACTGYCDNGEAAETTLPDVDITVEDGVVYLTDTHYTFDHEGAMDDEDGPDSTSHIGL